MSRKFLAIGVLSLLLAGCVSTETLKASEESCQDRLDNCRAEAIAQAQRCDSARLAQQRRFEGVTEELASCRQEGAACAAARQALESRLAASERERDRCQQDVAAAQASVSAMNERAAQLRQQLQEEITARNVEIEQLRGQLSVRVLDRILFRSGSADILPPGRAVLDKLAQVFAGSDGSDPRRGAHGFRADRHGAPGQVSDQLGTLDRARVQRGALFRDGAQDRPAAAGGGRLFQIPPGGARRERRGAAAQPAGGNHPERRPTALRKCRARRLTRCPACAPARRPAASWAGRG